MRKTDGRTDCDIAYTFAFDGGRVKYSWLPERMLIRLYHLFRHSCRQTHCLNHLYTVKPRPPGTMQLRTRGHQFELPAIKMNSTNETLLFDRFLIMYNLCVFTCIIFIFVFHCSHVRMSYILNSYLLTYLKHLQCIENLQYNLQYSKKDNDIVN